MDKKGRLETSRRHQWSQTETTNFSKTTTNKQTNNHSHSNADQTKENKTKKRCCQVRIVLKNKTNKRYKYKTVENRYLEVNKKKKATALSKPN